MKELFNEPKIIGIIGDVDSGKSNLAYSIIKNLREEFKFNLFTYGLREDIGSQKIYSINELEKIEDSIIFLDEFFTILDLDDRTKKKQIEQTFRLLHHHNNVIVLLGTPDNYKKFISSKINLFIYKRVTFEDFINGCSAKKNILNYNGAEKGNSVLGLNKDEAIIYDGHYEKINIPYLIVFDTKLNNKPILKNVGRNVEKALGKKIK